MSSVPLQTDESIAHPVTALQGFPATADRYKFKVERCPKLDPVTRAMELQFHFTISTLKSSLTPHLSKERWSCLALFDILKILLTWYSLNTTSSAGCISELEWNIHFFVLHSCHVIALSLQKSAAVQKIPPQTHCQICHCIYRPGKADWERQ